MNEPITIENATSPKDALINRGVATAIAYAFMNPGIVAKQDSREYAEIARAYWCWIPTDLIPKPLLDQNHSLYSGHKCSECREALLTRLVYDEQAQDRTEAEKILNAWISAFRDRNPHIACSKEVCEVNLLVETFMTPNDKLRRAVPRLERMPN